MSQMYQKVSNEITIHRYDYTHSILQCLESKCSLYNKRHVCIVYGIYCTHRNSECYTYHTNAACIIKGMYALYMAYIVLIATQNVIHIIQM